MKTKKIEYRNKTQKHLSKGVQKLTDAVKVTMGPRGRNVLIRRELQQPFLTKDGVTVAQEVFLSHPLQDTAAQIVKEVSYNTANEAGDGTTTSTVLTNAIFQNGLREINTHDPVEMKRGIDNACKNVITELKKQSKTIKDQDIKSVATISANGEVDIADLITDAIKAVGRDGIITVEENTKDEDELQVSEGYEFQRGYLSPYFVNNEAKGRVELEKPYILIFEGKIRTLTEMMVLLEQIQVSKKPLLIVADDFEGDTLQSLVLNNIKGIMNVTAVKAPGFGDNKDIRLRDLALKTGGKVASKATIELSKMTLADLGQAEKVYVNQDTTVIINGSGDPKEIEAQIKNLQEKEKETPDEFTQYRISKLSGGVAVIKVGASTEFELKERKDRYDDAVEATKSAIQEGIVVGGGYALIHAASECEPTPSKSESYNAGEMLLYESCSAPAYQILSNAGISSEEAHGTSKITEGYDIITEEVVDMFKMGIIDPLKVERIALENAASVAGSLLTTDVSII